MSGNNNSQFIRFMQQENHRLKKEVESLREENMRLRQYMDALRELQWATQQITSEENLMELIDQILHYAITVTSAEAGSLLILDEETDELVFVVVQGMLSDALRNYRIDREAGIAGWVAKHQESLIVDNPRQDRRFLLQVDEQFDFFTRSILCVPMMTQGKLVGVIQLVNKEDDSEFTDMDAILLSILAHTAAMALEEIRIRLDAEEQAEELEEAPQMA